MSEEQAKAVTDANRIEELKKYISEVCDTIQGANRLDQLADWQWKIVTDGRELLKR